MPSPSSTPNVGRFTGIVLGLVVVVCVTMIGGTGYLKYQLDRAQILLAAPEGATGTDQDMFDRLRRDLGYGGFLGLAQKYAMAHDTSGFAEMKADIKSADDIVAHLPDRTPAEARHELSAIVATYDSALQKISAPANETNGEFTVADLTPLYATLPILDARVSSASGETRVSAQTRSQFWGMLLTLVSWCSLILAAACAAGIYLTLRDKHSAPMRALAQSIANMARGDMRTAIWGTERQDMIGELARSVDTARYHFSHLPDLSLLSDQGPVRLRFEGGSRSLFEAMMKTISRDSENIREQTAQLTQTIQTQKDALGLMSAKVDHVLQNILLHGQGGDDQIRHAISEMVGSAENLKNAHAHAADQLNRLVPLIQDRAQGMAEIAHITGKQIGQTLQSLSASEAGFKANADQAKETMDRLFSTADDLGERLFGAINLLQASGKVLAETTQAIRSGGTGVIALAESGSRHPAPAIDAASLEPVHQYLSHITEQLVVMQSKMEDQWTRMQQAANTSDQHASRQSLMDLTRLVGERIEPKLAAIEMSLTRAPTQNPDVDNSLIAALHDRLKGLATSLPDLMRKTSDDNATRLCASMQLIQERIDQQKDLFLAYTDTLAAQTRESIAALGDKLSVLSSQHMTAGEPRLQSELLSLAAKIDLQNKMAAEQSEMAAVAMRQTMASFSDSIASLGRKLPDDIQHSLKTQWDNLSARMDGVAHELSHVLAVNVDPKLSAIERKLAAQDMPAIDTSRADQTIKEMQLLQNQFTHLQASVSALTMPETFNLPPQIVKQLDAHWYQMAAQIEGSRASIDKTISEQVASKLTDLSEKIESVTRSFTSGHVDPAGVAPSSSSSSLSAELQKQMDAHWYQMAAQIEASRASLLASISEQISKMETRIAHTASPDALSLSAADYSTQRQIEQQTQILSELVATLGVLDAHMQQIKSEIHASAR